MLLFSSDTKRKLIFVYKFRPELRENWFQYVRRVYATKINFPCIITLGIWSKFINIFIHSKRNFQHYCKIWHAWLTIVPFVWYRIHFISFKITWIVPLSSKVKYPFKRRGMREHAWDPNSTMKRIHYIIPPKRVEAS